MATGDGATAIALVAPLWRYWVMRGNVTEGRELTEAALALAGRPAGAAHARGQRRGHARRRAGRLRRLARALRGRSSSRARSAPASGRPAAATSPSSRIYAGDHETAIRRYEEATAVAREIGDERMLSLMMQNLGLAHEAPGHPARDRAARGERRARPRGATWPPRLDQAHARPRAARRRSRARARAPAREPPSAQTLADRNAIVDCLEIAATRRRSADRRRPARRRRRAARRGGRDPPARRRGWAAPRRGRAARRARPGSRGAREGAALTSRSGRCARARRRPR